MSVLGIKAHDGGASGAVLGDTQIIAAIEEERFNRRKHEARDPNEAAWWCLEQPNASPADVDRVVARRTRV